MQILLHNYLCLTGQLFSVSIHRGKYVLIAIFLAGLLMPRSPLRGGIDYGSLGFHRNLNRGIADERAYHYAYTGVWNANLEQHSQVVEGRKLEGQPRSVVFHANVGYFGFYAGPNVHLVDAYGLNEPLLARLYPDARFEIVLGSLGMEVKARPWRIGHFIRKPPAGYQKTQEQGENQIVDPNLAAYYDRMTHVVTGDLWDMDRLKTIWLFHLWQYEDLIRDRKAFMVFQRKAIGFVQQGQWEEAIDVLEQARALYPDHFENLFWMACLYQRVGDGEQAVEMLDRVLGKDPGFSPAVFNRILLLVQADKKEEALNYYKDVIWKRPDTLAVLRHLIFKLIELKQDDLADKFYLEGLRINPELKLN